ncbi:unnamed protein product [Prorocentrum cordatum]|uniref:KHDC4/BBP-like KH-domain type I domain-containing protein n=1 Tax=Prorocentrum cordatum TaxID=2364126 RepID=A0ABN9RS65_9DINO|nr:unnamed protein product [Polarella glacialis]
MVTKVGSTVEETLACPRSGGLAAGRWESSSRPMRTPSVEPDAAGSPSTHGARGSSPREQRDVAAGGRLPAGAGPAMGRQQPGRVRAERRDAWAAAPDRAAGRLAGIAGRLAGLGAEADVSLTPQPVWPRWCVAPSRGARAEPAALDQLSVLSSPIPRKFGDGSCTGVAAEGPEPVASTANQALRRAAAAASVGAPPGLAAPDRQQPSAAWRAQPTPPRVPAEPAALTWEQHAHAAPKEAPRPAPPPSPPARATECRGLAGDPRVPRGEPPRSAEPCPPCGQPQRIRLCAHILLHMQAPGFDLVPRLIGRSGCNMRRIFGATGAKVRIRGRGSGFLEGRCLQEAPIPLMVVVTAGPEDAAGFVVAVEMVLQELRGLEEAFRLHCRRGQLRPGRRCFSVEATGPARDHLAEALVDVPLVDVRLRGRRQCKT